MKKGMAGSLESNDVLVIVKESINLDIKIESIVYEFYGDDILRVVKETLQELKIDKLQVELSDKGALDYTIRARLITAIKRMEESDA